MSACISGQAWQAVSQLHGTTASSEHLQAASCKNGHLNHTAFFLFGGHWILAFCPFCERYTPMARFAFLFSLFLVLLYDPSLFISS